MRIVVFILSLSFVYSNNQFCPIVPPSNQTNPTCPDEEQCPTGSLYRMPSDTLGNCLDCLELDLSQGLYCFAGEPDLCPLRHYCPTPGSVPILCPSGHFCREGFYQPVPCLDGLQSCPEGSIAKGLGIENIILLIILLVIVVFIFVLQRYVKKRFIGSSDALFEKRKIIDNLVTNFIFKVTSGLDIRLPKMQGFTPDIRHAPISLEFFKLTLKLKNETQKIVLDNVSGEFPPGSIVAIMGPSGCGKSSFMNAISNRAPYGVVSGDIFIDGCLVDLGQCPKLVGFVPQDDIVHEDLTVFYNLYYSAMLRLPKDMPTDKKKKIVEDVILILDLESIKNTIVGSPEKRGISGGQKKRVNIGMELVAYPRILFLDEPTSGLDSSASQSVVNCLNRMKSLGITVVCVIHQPRYSIFRSFSHVLLLGKGGRTVYLGETGNIRSYFTDLGFVLPSGENVADWFIDIVSGTVPRINLKTQKVIPTTKPNFYLPALWKRHAAALLDDEEPNNRQPENAFAKPRIVGDDSQQIQGDNDPPEYSDTDSENSTHVSKMPKPNTLSLRDDEQKTPIERLSVIIDLIIDISHGHITMGDILECTKSPRFSTRGSLSDGIGSPKSPSRLSVFSAADQKHNFLASTELKTITTADLHSICCSLDIGTFTVDDVDEFVSLLSQMLNTDFLVGSEEEPCSTPMSIVSARSTSSRRPSFFPTPLSIGHHDKSKLIDVQQLLQGLIKLIRNNTNGTLKSPMLIGTGHGVEEEEEDVNRLIESLPSMNTFGQVIYLSKRNFLKFNYRSFAVFLTASFFAGALNGGISGTEIQYVTLPAAYAGTLIIYAVVIASANLHVFGKDKLIFYRENEVGVSVFAYWLAKNIVNIFEMIMLPFAFCTAWYFFTRADFGFANLYLVFFLVTLYINAASYVFSIAFTYPVALLLSVVVPAIYLSVFGGTDPEMSTMSQPQKIIAFTGPGVYAIQLLIIFFFEELSPNLVDLKPVNEVLVHYEVSFSNKQTYISYLILVGFVWRLMSLLLIYLYSKDIHIVSVLIKQLKRSVRFTRKKGRKDELYDIYY